MADFTVAAFIVGDQYMVSETSKKITSMFVKDDDELVICSSIEDVVSELTNPPFMGNKAVVFETPSVSKEIVDQISSIIEVSSSSCLAIVSAGSITAQAKKDVVSVGEPTFRMFTFSKSPKMGELANFVIKRVVGNGGSVTKADAEYLVSIVGSDYWCLSQEVDKIMLVAQNLDRKTIAAYAFPLDHAEYHRLYSCLRDANAAGAVLEARGLVDAHGYESVDLAISRVVATAARSISTSYTGCVDIAPHRLNEHVWWPNGMKSGNPVPTKFLMGVADEIAHRHGKNGVESIMRFIMDDMADIRLFPDTRHVLRIEMKILAICGKDGCPQITEARSS